MRWAGSSPFRLAALELGVVDQQLDPARGDVEPDQVAVAHEAERAADRRFRRDVQHDRAEGGAAHARVGNADHVLDAGLRELLRDRQIAGLRHAGRALGPGIAQDQDVVRRHVEIGIVDARDHVLDRLEHHGPAGMRQQGRGGGRMLDDRSARREIAAQHRHAAGLLQRIAWRCG